MGSPVETAVWHLFEGMAVVFFDTSVDLNTVQVKSSTVQLRGFSFENCRKSQFDSRCSSLFNR